MPFMAWGPIATTNYDTLLSRGRGIEAVPWTDSAAAIEILRDDRQGILHLYGYYDRPESVVLGAAAYAQLRASLVAQTVQQMAALSRTLLFVGCGTGLYDPNLGERFAWNQRVLRNTIYRHYCLCRTDDRAWLQSCVPGDRLVYIEYGSNYSDLGPFLRDLASQRWSLARSQVTVVPSGTSRSEELMAEDRVDVGIVVALVEEFRELYRLLPLATPYKDLSTGTSDYLFEHPMKNGGSYRCAATFVGIMGPTEAALATERFLNRRNPATVVMLGIAAGIHDDVKLGDVIVAQHVGRYLDRAKIVDGVENFDIRPGGDSFPCSADLVRAALELEFADRPRYEEWIEQGRTDLSTLVKAEQRDALLAKESLRNEPQLLHGQVASGPVVTASKKFVKWVKSTNRNYLALEMEGGAMLAAVYSRAQPKQSLMLRGISDFGDQRKKSLDAVGKGGIRRYAMRNATKMLWALMDAGVLPHATTDVVRSAPPSQHDPLPLPADHNASIRIKGRPETDALGVWKAKLAFLRRQEAILSDAAQLFTLRMQIEEAERHISSLEQ
jgi:nucleoside phosphorylase